MTVCRRYARDQKEAEDILQESFMRVFERIEQYRFEGSLEGWIRRIVVHTALRMLQNKTIQYSPIGEDENDAPSVDAEALDHLGAEELLLLIGALPEGYRFVFNLYVLEGYGHNEIASMLNITAATSRSQLLKARRLLRARIEQQTKLPTSYVR